jgi:hypothetical protein
LKIIKNYTNPNPNLTLTPTPNPLPNPNSQTLTLTLTLTLTSVICIKNVTTLFMTLAKMVENHQKLQDITDEKSLDDLWDLSEVGIRVKG